MNHCDPGMSAPSWVLLAIGVLLMVAGLVILISAWRDKP